MVCCSHKFSKADGPQCSSGAHRNDTLLGMHVHSEEKGVKQCLEATNHYMCCQVVVAVLLKAMPEQWQSRVVVHS